jgi:hypothetical protein
LSRNARIGAGVGLDVAVNVLTANYVNGSPIFGGGVTLGAGAGYSATLTNTHIGGRNMFEVATGEKCR